MEEITAAAFIQMLQDGHRHFNDKKVTGEVSITQDDFAVPNEPTKALVIEGCEFDRSLVLNKINLGYGVQIKNTKISEHLSIKHCWSEIEETDVRNNNLEELSILLKTVKVDGTFYLGGRGKDQPYSHYKRSLQVSDKCQFGTFRITAANFSMSEVFIKDSTIRGALQISHTDTLNGIHIEQSVIDGYVHLKENTPIILENRNAGFAPLIGKKSNEARSFSFRSVEIKGPLDIDVCHFAHGLAIEDATINGHCRILGCYALDWNSYDDHEAVYVHKCDVAGIFHFGFQRTDSQKRERKSEYHGPLVFENLTVKGQAKFNQINVFRSIEITENSNFRSLQFSNCDFVGQPIPAGPYGSDFILSCRSFQVANAFVIFDCSFKTEGEVSGPNQRLPNAVELNKGIINSARIQAFSPRGHFLMRELEIMRSLSITNHPVKAFQFESLTVHQDVAFLTACSSLQIRKGTFGGTFTIDMPDSSTTLSISDSVLSRGAWFKNTVTNYLHLERIKAETPFIIDVGREENENRRGSISSLAIIDGNYEGGLALNINNRTIPKAELLFHTGLQGSVRFNDGDISELHISGIINSGGIVKLDTIELRKLYISKLSNFGDLFFSDCTIPEDEQSILSLTKSRLGKADFMNFNFKRFTEVEFSDSFLGDIQYSSTDWFEPEQVNPNLNVVENDGIKRDLYRQLKQAAEKNGDRVQSLRFKADEFSFYRRLLRNEIKELRNQNKQKRMRRRLRAERCSLWLSSFTNDLGQTWIRPLRQILLITLPVYVFIVVEMDPNLTFNPIGTGKVLWCEGFKTVLNQTGVYMQLLNPTHFLSRIFDGDEYKYIPQSVQWIDGLYRIVLAIYIYQIISAFRKYFK